MTYSSNALKQIQSRLKEQKIDAFLLPLIDPFGSEYVTPYYNAFPWITGFTGSTAFAILTPKQCAIFLDGRYILQGKQQIPQDAFKIIPYTTGDIQEWLKQNVSIKGCIGYDPWLFSINTAQHWEASLTTIGFRVQPVQENPVHSLWPQRPPKPSSYIHAFSPSHAGASFTEKATQIWKRLSPRNIDTFLLTDPASICWLLNIRGQDVPHTPLLLSYAFIHKDNHVDLFVHTLENAIKHPFEEKVEIHSLDNFATCLQRITGTIAWDQQDTPMAMQIQLHNTPAQKIENPCKMLKAQKNATEIANAHQAHIDDGVAMVKFLHWLESTLKISTLSEFEAAEKLDTFRRTNPRCKGPSFDTISGSGSHSAIIHFKTIPNNARPLKWGDIYLVDSGGQYAEGTTDVTRTLALGGHPTPQQKDVYTRVLKGMIKLTNTVFPQGTVGATLDAFARADLWKAGLDYPHATGHGVGQYLSVHEGPCSISPRNTTVPLLSNMILSNEPGCYLENDFGVRIENLMCVCPHPAAIGSNTTPFLCFDTLTLVPLDPSLILFEELEKSDKEWLATYHRTILKMLSPLLEQKEQQWLEAICRRFASTTRI